MRNARSYAVQAQLTTVTTAKTLAQIKAGAASPLYIDYISVEGQSDVADAMEILLLRKSVAATVTAFTPTPLNESAGTEQVALAVGGTAATGTNASAEGTDGDILDRWSVSVQAGGGLQIWFPEGQIMVGAGAIIALKLNNTITSATLTVTVHFSEVG